MRPAGILMSDLSDAMHNSAEEILVIIEYANALMAISSMPQDIINEIFEGASECNLLLEKYGNYLQNKGAVGFKEQGDKIITSFGEEMLFVYDFSYLLDAHLRDYGEGPLFSKDRIFCVQPLEI